MSFAGSAFAALPGRFLLSIRGKLITLTVGVVVVFIWVLVSISSTVLQDHFDRVLLEQQLATTGQLAAELDTKLQDRVRFLSRAAQFVPPGPDTRALAAFLAQRTSLHVVFSGGIAIIGLDGVTLADYPAAPGRRGIYFGDRDYFRQVVLTGQPYIDRPVLGRALQRPVLTIAVPVWGADGKLRAVMTGITDLTAANFLGLLTDRGLAGAAEFFIVSRRDRLLIAATDKSRELQPISEPGQNPTLDRFLGGFEGSAFGLNSQGIAKLYSARKLASADWLVIAALPADVARRPVAEMQRYLYGAAGLVTLLLAAILWVLTRRVLAPLEAAGQAIRGMTSGQVPLEPLPVTMPDEVGQLIGDFNLLVQERRRYEAKFQQTNRELHAFTYAASHDMKAPLGRINAFGSLLEQKYRDRLEGEGLLFLDLVRRNTRRLMALVEDLLVHAEFGQKTLTLRPVPLKPLVEGVLQGLEEEIRQGNAEIRLDLPEMAVVANRQALVQVLRNLLENALKYSRAAQAPIIEIGGQAMAGQGRVWVKDNGIGFDMAYHDRIFEVLRRLHTYEEFPGSGVGLALVKKAMECMGGKVWAESEPGQGATFYLELPMGRERAAAQATAD